MHSKHTPIEEVTPSEYIDFKGVYRATVHITDKCNLNCIYCGFDSGRNKHDELPYKTIVDIVQILSSNNIQHLDLSGGEPTIRTDFFQILDKIDKTPLSLGLLTNGTQITELFAKQLDQHQIHSIKISFDGLKEEHDRLRGTGAYDKALSGLRNIINHTSIPTKVLFTLTSYNGNDVIELVKKLADLGIWRLVIRPCDPNGRSDNSFIPSETLVEAVYRDLLKIANCLPDDFIELSFVNPFPKLGVWANNPYVMLEESGRHITILSNGDVMVDYCQYLEMQRTGETIRNGKEGNLFERDLNKMLCSIISRIDVSPINCQS